MLNNVAAMQNFHLAFILTVLINGMAKIQYFEVRLKI